VRMEVASGAESRRQEQAMEHYRQLRASSEAPLDEKTLLERERAAAKGR
jgi:acyl-CoA oxidase